ncbi:LysR substrate-binding domain-containing protein [Glaciimonas sp. PCH181]|uniref:LysR substrate-binding domain-containing protein n=1 Tax=Glaciimonas sp. PCH181 TaxID=2133943 RepID=UPI000D387B20|nr:LysR substrate-binding domain-containing protein [Glaciimonas sp. PCH181]PUA16953.1 LysR family transcriptional regulator [Glaciimonas sp. PCH181]
MELRHLRYFLALAEELNFTRAAERLHVSQPPFSLQIRQLEEEVGARLFGRTSRRVQLTPAGQAFLIDTRAILERVDASISRAAAIESGLAGRIELGLSGSHFFGRLPKLIAGYSQAYSDVTISLQELKPAIQLEALRERRIDLSISRTPVNDMMLKSIRLWADPLMAAVPPGHRLRRRKRLTLRDLRDEPFVMLKLDTSAYAQHIRDCCVQAGFAPRVVHHVSEVAAVLGLVAAGMGVALIPESLSHIYADKVTVIPLATDEPHSEVYVVQHSEENANVTNAFVRFITSHH